MKSAVTISLVTEARSGPFVFHDGLADGCMRASKLGFDAVEVFPPNAEEVKEAELRALLQSHRLELAAMGTGAGWIKHQWSLSSADKEIRRQARHFIRSIIDRAGAFGAPAIVGSMQGKFEAARSRTEALDILAEELGELSEHSQRAHGVRLLFEPLNRYESNLFNRLEDAVEWLQANNLHHVAVLADLFHMNIEESHMGQAIERADKRIGHVHFADSNRQAIGFGHLNAAEIVCALRTINYSGYLSAEIFPKPDSDRAASQTIQSFRRLVN